VIHMRVLLIQPPVQDFYDTDVRLQPIGLCYLKAAIAKHLPGIDVIVRDYHGGAGRKTVPIPKELRYLTDYYGTADKSDLSPLLSLRSAFCRHRGRNQRAKSRRRRRLVAIHALLPRGT